MSRSLLIVATLVFLVTSARATDSASAGILTDFARAAETELRGNILPFWMKYVPHPDREGFYGEVSREGKPRANAPRAALMTSRILWTFSAAYRVYGAEEYRRMAERAYRDLTQNFLDPEHGGVFWAISATGEPTAPFKHVYGQAFALYALAEYHRATGDPDALRHALELFSIIEDRARDSRWGGYNEAFTRDWKPQRPGARVVVGPPGLKSQNTHLHIMEAYANLLRASANASVRQAQRELIELILTRIVDPETAHLGLFFEPDWMPRSTEISYGHDIEFAWLVTEAAEELGDAALLERVRPLAVRVAEVTLARGVAQDGGIPYEVAADGTVLEAHREWWVPAEAAVGFLNAYQLSRDARFLEAARGQWAFIQRHLVDRQHGEWFHSVSPTGEVNRRPAKASAWKCSYHNGRACLELAQRARALAAPVGDRGR